MSRIVQLIVIIEEGGPNQTLPTVQVSERSWLLDLNTFDTIEVQPSPDFVDNAFHEQQGGIVIDELEIGPAEATSSCTVVSSAGAIPVRGAAPSITRGLFGKSEKPAQGKKGELTGTSGILFPGYNYLGPGNRGYNGPPTNEVDAAAKRHDNEYAEILQRLKETGDEDEAYRAVQKADERFLKVVRTVEPESYLEFAGKIAGTVGIGSKKLLEGALGFSLYPLVKIPRVEVNISNKLELPKVNVVNVPFTG